MWLEKLTELLTNNLGNILKFFGGVFSVSFIINLIQYKENRKLKKYHNEKELKIKEAELKAEIVSHENFRHTISYSFLQLGEYQEKEINYNLKVSKLVSEIEYINKILGRKK